MKFTSKAFLTIPFIALTLLAGCQSDKPDTIVPPVSETAVTEVVPIPTPTPEGPKELNICLGDEPQTLYLYGGASKAQWSVLDAVYDGPFDYVRYAYEPTILEKTPSLENGGEVIAPVEAKLNMIVADINGQPIVLTSGSRVFPAGCRDLSCAVEWDGKTPLQLDQQTISYQFKPGILWSDGLPLTADDSLFSFEVAANPVTKINPLAISRTASYVKVNDTTIEWKGIPGYISPDPAAYFFLPLPRHALKDIPVAELTTAEASAVKPMGWGPYSISAWEKGKQITLQVNPNYYRAAEGLPKFTTINFKFFGPNADNNLFALADGQCDVIAESTLLEEQIFSVRNMELEGKLKAHVALGPEVEYLFFGIEHAAIDGALQPSLVNDLRTRQGIASCINRDAFDEKLFNSLNETASGFFPPDNPAYIADLPGAIFNVDEANRLLDEAGWKDTDGDPATPRTAANVSGVADGTPLTLRYLTTTDSVRVTTAEQIKADLKACGVGVEVTTLEPGELFSPGPDGAVFGRSFDLAQFSWSSGRTSPCGMFTSAQVPASENNWSGTNVTGLSSAAYDTACAKALSTPHSDTGYLSAQTEVQKQFVADLPALPLYYQVHISTAKPQICGIDANSSSRSEFWNIESWKWADNCPATP